MAIVLQKTAHVVGASMTPGLESGQWLWQESRAPTRGELAVIIEPDSGEKVVKRCVAIQGDTVQIVGGKLYINGETNTAPISGIKDLLAEWPGIDSELENKFMLKNKNLAYQNGWWTSSAKATQVGLQKPNDHFGHAFEVTCKLQPSTSFTLVIARGSNQYRLSINSMTSEWSIYSFDDEKQVNTKLAHGMLVGEPGQEHDLLISVAHNQLSAFVDGVHVGESVTVEATKDWTAGGDSPHEQLFFEMHGQCSFKNVKIGCEINYDISGNFGVAQVLKISGDEFFFLGDNSKYSRDSRHYGPVSAAQVIGVATKLWPRNADNNGWPFE